MRKLLEFDKILGYYPSDAVVVLLKDGRYAMVDTRAFKSKSAISISVSKDKITFLRGKEVTKNIPQDLIDKTRSILMRDNLKIHDVSC